MFYDNFYHSLSLTNGGEFQKHFFTLKIQWTVRRKKLSINYGNGFSN
jgi:hypothetical protein